MDIIRELSATLGAAHVLQGADTARYGQDWAGSSRWQPLAVARPADTAEVAAVMRIAHHHRCPVVPVSGNTGVAGGTRADGALMLSLERLNRLREIRPAARVAIAEAGVVIATLHEAAAAHDLAFPLSFGAAGSAMIGGALATNAGGSNVLRHGNARALCLGIEVVLADGRIVDMMSALHKDNTGYDLRDLFIGAEGTLGIITAAVLRLVPAPLAHATAMLAMDRLGSALALLNRLQAETGGAVEAFEYMPGHYMDRLARFRPDLAPAFDRRHEVNILVELAATAPDEARASGNGTVPLSARLESILSDELAAGRLLDAHIAASEAQRRQIWARREAAAEITLNQTPLVNCDIALPLDRFEAFFPAIAARIRTIDPGASELVVAHLGDGNIHYTLYPGTLCRDDPHLTEALHMAVEDVVAGLGGSFSAEHGIGMSKLASMRRRKDPVALDVMRAIRAALDPAGILNPGKTVP